MTDDKEAEQYLGDGLYALFDGYQLRLRAPRGFEEDHVVYLDRSVLEAFKVFVAEKAGW